MARVPRAHGAADPYEADLVRRAQQRDVEAFAELYRRYRPAILRLANSKLRDYHVAEEVVQETFVRAYVSITRFDTSRPFGPWLATIATNMIVDVKRRWGRYVSTDHADHVVHHGGRDEPLERVLSLEAVRRVRSVIQQLPSRQRRILEATAFQDLSASQVAMMERTSESGVASAVYRARAGVRRGLRRLATVFVAMRTLRMRHSERTSQAVRSLANLETLLSAAPGLTAIALMLTLSVGTLTPVNSFAVSGPPLSKVSSRVPSGSRYAVRDGAPTAGALSSGGVTEELPVQTVTQAGPTRDGAILPSYVDGRIQIIGPDGNVWVEATGLGYGCPQRRERPLLPINAPFRAVCG